MWGLTRISMFKITTRKAEINEKKIRSEMKKSHSPNLFLKTKTFSAMIRQ